MSTFDPETSLGYRAYDFSDGLKNAKRTIMKKVTDLNEVDESDLIVAMNDARNMHNETFNRVTYSATASMPAVVLLTGTSPYAELTDTRSSQCNLTRESRPSV